MIDFTIETAKSSDVEELLTLSRKVTNHNSRMFLSKEMVDSFLESKFFIEEITNNTNKMTLIKVEDKIIGLCVWIDAELVSLMVDPDYQGKGVAKRFLKEMMNRKLSKFDELYLECFKDNLRANAFYKKLGWKLSDCFLDDDLKIMRNKYKFIKKDYS